MEGTKEEKEREMDRSGTHLGWCTRTHIIYVYLVSDIVSCIMQHLNFFFLVFFSFDHSPDARTFFFSLSRRFLLVKTFPALRVPDNTAVRAGGGRTRTLYTSGRLIWLSRLNILPAYVSGLPDLTLYAPYVYDLELFLPTAGLCISTQFAWSHADLSIFFFTYMCLTLLEPQSRFGDKPFKFQVVCPQNGTAVLKGLTASAHWCTYHVSCKEAVELFIFFLTMCLFPLIFHRFPAVPTIWFSFWILFRWLPFKV